MDLNCGFLKFRNADGKVLTHDMVLNSKSGKSRMRWESLGYKTAKGHSYQYDPRGRVEIRRKNALIFLKPIFNDEMVTEQIRVSFGQSHPKIQFVRIKRDGSKHHYCRLGGSIILCAMFQYSDEL